MEGIYNFQKLEAYLMHSKSPEEIAEMLREVRKALQKKSYRTDDIFYQFISEMIDLFENIKPFDDESNK